MLLIELVTWGVTNWDVLLLATTRYIIYCAWMQGIGIKVGTLLATIAYKVTLSATNDDNALKNL